MTMSGTNAVRRIVVVCGLGASSSFVAHRVRHAAGEAGLAVTVTPCALTDLADHLAGTDVVLVAAHVVGDLDRIRDAAARHGATVAVLPDSVLHGGDGHEVLPLIDSPNPSPGTTASPAGPATRGPGGSRDSPPRDGAPPGHGAGAPHLRSNDHCSRETSRR